MNPATAAWSQYAAAAAAWGAQNPTNPPNDSNSSNNVNITTEEHGRLSGKEVRERLREQVGWTDPPYEDDSVNGNPNGRDGDSTGRPAKEWGKKKWKKRSEEPRLNSSHVD